MTGFLGKIGNNHALGIPAVRFSDHVLCHFNIRVPGIRESLLISLALRLLVNDRDTDAWMEPGREVYQFLIKRSR